MGPSRADGWHAARAREPSLPVEAAPELGAASLAGSLVVALEADGWSIEAPPAEPVLACRGDDRLGPHVVVDDLRHERMEPAAWRARATELGIAGLPLHPAAAHQSPVETGEQRSVG